MFINYGEYTDNLRALLCWASLLAIVLTEHISSVVVCIRIGANLCVSM